MIFIISFADIGCGVFERLESWFYLILVRFKNKEMRTQKHLNSIVKFLLHGFYPFTHTFSLIPLHFSLFILTIIKSLWYKFLSRRTKIIFPLFQWNVIKTAAISIKTHFRLKNISFHANWEKYTWVEEEFLYFIHFCYESLKLNCFNCRWNYRISPDN